MAKKVKKNTLPTDLKIVDLHRLIGLEQNSSEFSMLGGDYLFAHIQPGQKLAEMWSRTPVRIRGTAIFLCIKGSFDVEVNLVRHTVTPGMLLIVNNESIMQLLSSDMTDVDVYMFLITPEFMNDINIDVAVLQTIKLRPNAIPLLQLTPDEERIVRTYLEMIHTNTVVNTEPMYVRSISRCLMAAVVYQMMQYGRDRTKSDEPVTPGVARRNNYVRDFIKLVHKHHKRERSVSFYASELFISSKYLSMLVREASGRSAAEWIDEYVILEAKNQLRFSGKNIQQIAYDLNFPNQSAFGKYFKHLTGMSPSEFQRS
ncbi:MAG: helix-turn-helix domain-containing protein [Paramuribaculum sp.]|nr:helix-turn-helix domain-containing protein [Candidatus Amulumruptor sp.]MDE6587722.1 helix-turn-helix domain-containing protein [Paramuribaculum sp.]MDE7151442.1 helix-turn-helix domain-containing protein [Candidatus Amulumruptor sp.]